MKHITRHYRKIGYWFIRASLFFAFVWLFFIPSFIRADFSEDNIFYVTLNGENVGIVSSEDQAYEYLREIFYSNKYYVNLVLITCFRCKVKVFSLIIQILSTNGSFYSVNDGCFMCNHFLSVCYSLYWVSVFPIIKKSALTLTNEDTK